MSLQLNLAFDLMLLRLNIPVVRGYSPLMVGINEYLVVLMSSKTGCLHL